MKTFVICFILGWLLAGDPAWGHDIYEELTRDSKCTCGPIERLCEPVDVQILDAETYFLPASGETFPRRFAEQSPDGRFHRCTYPLNQYWSTPGYSPAYPGAQFTPGAPMIQRQGPEAWITRPDNSTKDGKPKTRCLWAPMLTN